jgi:hypothetical protein
MGITNATSPLVYNSGTQNISLDQDAFDHLSSLGYLQFNLGSTATDAPGRLLWNDVDGTLNLQGKNGGVTLQLGQESVQLVTNQTGAAIADGSIVKVVGSVGGRISVALADNTTALGATGVIGIATQNLASGGQGYVTTFGVVHGVNTVGMAGGAPLYLSSGGTFTNVRPNNGILIQVGFVLDGGLAAGSVLVNPQDNSQPNVGAACSVPGQTGIGTYQWANVSGRRYYLVCDLP